MKLRIALATVLFCAGTFGAHAQSNPKREKCLQEAAVKGLWTQPTGGRGGNQAAQSNKAMAPQRQAFMKQCMAGR